MSVRQGHTEERTPAPAGAYTRILEGAEASAIGMAPWMLEELESLPLLGEAFPPALLRSEESAGAAELQSRIDQLQQRHRQELQDATERARREAEARFQARLEGEVEPWMRRMAQSIEDVTSVRKRYLEQSEEKLVRLAVAIARRILYREIQVDSVALLGLLRAAISQSETRELNRVLLNPKDLEALRPHLQALNLPPRVEVNADATLERGAMLFESTTGMLDASIQSQLDEVERGFIDMLGKRG